MTRKLESLHCGVQEPRVFGAAPSAPASQSPLTRLACPGLGALPLSPGSTPGWRSPSVVSSTHSASRLHASVPGSVPPPPPPLSRRWSQLQPGGESLLWPPRSFPPLRSVGAPTPKPPGLVLQAPAPLARTEVPRPAQPQSSSPSVSSRLRGSQQQAGTPGPALDAPPRSPSGGRKTASAPVEPQVCNRFPQRCLCH